MASFELFPDPAVLVVETGIFLVNVAIIKKLMLDPYLQLKDKREAATIGSKEGASAVLNKCESIASTISATLTAAAEETVVIKDAIITDAASQRDALLKTAEGEAKATIDAIQTAIQKQLSEERSKIDSVVSQLTEEVYSLAVN